MSTDAKDLCPALADEPSPFFKAWRAARGWSLAKTSRELGRAENSLIGYERPGAETPKTVALAMQALDFKDLLDDLTKAIGGLGTKGYDGRFAEGRVINAAKALVERANTPGAPQYCAD